MRLVGKGRARRALGRCALPVVALVATLCLGAMRDAPAHARAQRPVLAETPLPLGTPPERVDSWTRDLGPVDVESLRTRDSVRVRLYRETGEVDEEARAAFERVANDGNAHELAPRLEQLVMKAAYHYGRARVLVVSAWRAAAGRHTAGEALDFKLEGVPPGKLAAYLRGLPRAGVGIYTHPRTQFVHLDVRDESYHWVDGAPPGRRGREWALPDRGMKKRDADYRPAMDLPL